MEIYHEVQESLLCGQHCLNNLLQAPYFTPVDLADIAQELDNLEYQNMIGLNGEVTNDTLQYLKEGSGNVDESGNFSIQVLKTAVERSHGLELISWGSSEGRNHIEPSEENAFILNRQSHWFTLRKINNRWWNLNSTLLKPEEITEFYLSAFLAQFREEGYSVFIVKGDVPVQSSRAFGDGYGFWYSESTLLGHSNEEKTQEEKDLEEAIKMSLNAGKMLGGGSISPTLTEEERKLEMREKRLAAMEKR